MRTHNCNHIKCTSTRRQHTVPNTFNQSLFVSRSYRNPNEMKFNPFVRYVHCAVRYKRTINNERKNKIETNWFQLRVATDGDHHTKSAGPLNLVWPFPMALYVHNLFVIFSTTTKTTHTHTQNECEKKKLNKNEDEMETKPLIYERWMSKSKEKGRQRTTSSIFRFTQPPLAYRYIYAHKHAPLIRFKINSLPDLDLDFFFPSYLFRFSFLASTHRVDSFIYCCLADLENNPNCS